MTLLASLSGNLHVELTSPDVARFLDQATQMGLQLLDVTWENDLTIRFLVSTNGHKILAELAQRQGAELRILSHEGIYWGILGLLSRPLFLTGMLLMLLTGIFLPGRIFFLDVQGNHSTQTPQILEAASECGIRFGASRRLVRSEQVKNQLIKAVPELQWVGVNTKGCVAIISVREKTVQMTADAEPEPGNIVASRDGIVLDCSATRGSLLCTVGQAVSEGDVLISGSSSYMDVTTFTGASGEIFAATQRIFAVQTPDSSGVRGENSGGTVKFSLLIGKNLINFFKGSGISGSSCVKMYSKYVLTLPGGFTLPVALVKWTMDSCAINSEGIKEDEARELLSDYASGYLKEQMIAGRIIRKDEILAQAQGVYQLTGTYACTEMIGRVQKEQIGAYNGKTD